MRKEIEGKIYFNAIGFGKIAKFDFMEVQKSLLQDQAEAFYDDLEQKIIDLSVIFRDIKHSLTDVSENATRIMNIIFNHLDSGMFYDCFRTHVQGGNLTVSEAYSKAVHEHFNKDNTALYREIGKDVLLFREYLYDLVSRITLHYEMYVFKRFTERLLTDYIVVVDEFKIEYLDEMSERMKGMICKKAKNLNLVREYSNSFEIPIVIARIDTQASYNAIVDAINQRLIINPEPEDIIEYREILKEQTFLEGEKPRYHSERVKLYAQMVDDRYINRIVFDRWFQGVCPFKSEYMISTNELHLTYDYQYNFFCKTFKEMKNKEFFYRIPDFRHERPTVFLGDVYTDVETYELLAPILDDILLAVARAAKKYDVDIHVIVPMIRMPEEVKFWRDTIKVIFDTAGVFDVKIGIVIETESALEYFEDYPKMDFIIIGLNDLAEEISDEYDRYSPLSKEEFIELFWPDIRELHQHLRSFTMQVKHIVSGNCLTNPWIFKKLINSGFTHFAVPVNQIRKLEKMLEQYENTRGFYIGYAELHKKNEDVIKANQLERERRRILKSKAQALEKYKKAREKRQQIRDEHKEKREIAIQKMLDDRDSREKTEKVEKKKKNPDQK